PKPVDAGHGAERGRVLGNDSAADERSRCRAGKEASEFGHDSLLNLLVARAAQASGSADDDLEVVLALRNLAAVEQPLAQTIDEHRVWQLGYWPIVPKVHADDRRRL